MKYRELIDTITKHDFDSMDIIEKQKIVDGIKDVINKSFAFKEINYEEAEELEKMLNDNVYTVTENTEIILNGKKYLLEAGDKIVLETLDSSERSRLVPYIIKEFGPVTSPEDYWKRIKNVKDHFIAHMKKIRKKFGFDNPKVELKISHIKDFINDDVGNFVLSLADTKTQELINQDKLQRIKDSKVRTNINTTLNDNKTEKEKNQVKQFGKTAAQAVADARKENKSKEDKLFESIILLDDHI